LTRTSILSGEELCDTPVRLVLTLHDTILLQGTSITGFFHSTRFAWSGLIGSEVNVVSRRLRVLRTSQNPDCPHQVAPQTFGLRGSPSFLVYPHKMRGIPYGGIVLDGNNSTSMLGSGPVLSGLDASPDPLQLIPECSMISMFDLLGRRFKQSSHPI
jgi:hypothetical protein